MCGFVRLLLRTAHPPGFPEFLRGTLDSRRAHTKPGSASAELVPGRRSRPGQGCARPQQTPAVIDQCSASCHSTETFARSDVSQAFPPCNHQFHLQFFNKLLNYTSLNDTLQIQQVLIANDGSERLSFDCN